MHNGYVTKRILFSDKSVHVSSSDCNITYYKNNRGNFICRVGGNGRNAKFDWVFKTDGGEDRDVEERMCACVTISLVCGEK